MAGVPAIGGLATDDGSAPGIGKRRGGRGPSGAGGTSPKRGASSGRRPAAWPASMAAAASSAPMMRTLSLDGRGPRGRSRSRESSGWSSLGRSLTMTSGQTSSSSCSLCCTIRSISATYSWVSFSSSFSARSSSSEEISPVLLQVFELVTGGAAQVAHRHPPLLGLVLHDLHQLLATLLGELRERQADDLAVVRGVDAEVGVLDGLLDGLHVVLVVGLDHEQPRLGHVEAGQLLEGTSVP